MTNHLVENTIACGQGERWSAFAKYQDLGRCLAQDFRAKFREKGKVIFKTKTVK